MSGMRENRADVARAAASVRLLRNKAAARRFADVQTVRVRSDRVARVVDGCGAVYRCYCAECSNARHR